MEAEEVEAEVEAEEDGVYTFLTGHFSGFFYVAFSGFTVFIR